MSDDLKDEYRAAACGRIGADRMILGLACIPDPERGDMQIVADLRVLVAVVTEQRNYCRKTLLLVKSYLEVIGVDRRGDSDCSVEGIVYSKVKLALEAQGVSAPPTPPA
jgi:hypothetical protein